MPFEISQETLERSLSGGPLILDVRGGEEVLRHPFITPRPAESLNVPYGRFIENEPEAVDEVSAWMHGRRRPIVVVGHDEKPEFVADLLRGEGYSAFILEGGRKPWLPEEESGRAPGPEGRPGPAAGHA